MNFALTSRQEKNNNTRLYPKLFITVFFHHGHTDASTSYCNYMFQMMECFRLNGLLERTTHVDKQTVFSFSYPSTFSTSLSFLHHLLNTAERRGKKKKKSKTIMISRFFMRTKPHPLHSYFQHQQGQRSGWCRDGGECSVFRSCTLEYRHHCE